MTSHPNRSQGFPVLDDNSSDAMVLGFAKDMAGAERIGRQHAAKHGRTYVRCEAVASVKVTYNPDINTKAEADRANAAARGFVVYEE